MNCPNCNRGMTPLFLSMACDWCDMDDYSAFQGWILPDEIGADVYVFRQSLDAERWRDAAGRSGEVLLVHLSSAPRWQMSRGTLRDVVLADRMHTLRPDHRHVFESVPTCWIANKA